MATKGNTILAGLDHLVEKYHLLKHPFYRAWTQGTLSRESLALYAEQYYQHVLAFPENLRQLSSRANGDLRQLVDENLAEELDPADPHPALWRQFAGSVGAREAALDSTRPLPGIAALLDTFDELSENGSKAQAVAAFYVYETQVPEIATQKIAGLKKYYGISDESALRYFAVHEEADVRHRASWRQWLAARPEEECVGVCAAGERALKALWGALDAVYPRGCANASKN
ncbi:MAG: CADD family putative folate metabolism protein [Candidatus Acidiferrales bacterium]